MTQYLLSVHMAEGDDPAPGEMAAGVQGTSTSRTKSSRPRAPPPARPPSRCGLSRGTEEQVAVAATDVPDVEKTFRREFGRAVATLVQEAFVVAVERWPTSGIPPNPGG